MSQRQQPPELRAGKAEKDLAEVRRAAAEDAQSFRNTVQRLHRERDSSVQRVEDLEREALDLRKQLADLQEHVNSQRAAPHWSEDELYVELDRAWNENRELGPGPCEIGLQIADLGTQLHNLKKMWSSLQATSSPAPDSAEPPAEEAAPVERTFDSVAQALSAAETEWADILEVWSSAQESAGESGFLNPEKVYLALQAIGEVGRDYFSSQDGGEPLGPLDQAIRSRVPFKYSAFESRSTKGMYGAERVFRDGSRSQQMQRHLTLGGGQTTNCLQIYFALDDQRRKVTIGYCGRHLNYYRQRT